MLFQTASQVVGHSGVQHRPVPVRDDVNPEVVFFFHGRLFFSCHPRYRRASATHKSVPLDV